jgi:uncharacterized membrane protein YfcA
MYTTPLNVLLIALCGAVTGVLGAVLGTGGGVFLIPILVLGFGVPMHYAVATSIVSVIATSSAVASTNVQRGTANMPLGMTLEVATTIGAILGGLTAGWLAAQTLEGLFAVVLLPIAYLMWHGRTEKSDYTLISSEDYGTNNANNIAPSKLQSGFAALDGRYYDESEGREIIYHVRHLEQGWGISLLAGGVSGLLGIGGGVFKVPALNLLCKIPIKAAAATSNFMIGVTASASAFLYYGRGEVRPALTAATILGVLVGSAFGSILNRRIRGSLVRRLFAILLIFVALQMMYRAWFTGA